MQRLDGGGTVACLLCLALVIAAAVQGRQRSSIDSSRLTALLLDYAALTRGSEAACKSVKFIAHWAMLLCLLGLKVASLQSCMLHRSSICFGILLRPQQCMTFIIGQQMSCGVTMAVPKVAMMFLVRGGMPLSPVWEAW